MIYMSDVIKRFKVLGFSPVLNSRGTLIRLFPCPECKHVRMMKFQYKSDRRAVVRVCPCGSRHYSPKATSKVHGQTDKS